MVVSAFILGLAGSLHCIGMCSPLALAVTSMRSDAAVNRFVYHIGRLFTYAMLGALMTALGYMLNISSWQTWISISIGIALIVMGTTGLKGFYVPVLTPVLIQFSTFLKSVFGFFLKKKGHASVFVLGMLNGFLPCGLTYLALTYCITLAGPLDGFNFMLMFGVGTLPAMLGLATVIQLLINRFKVNASLFTRYSFIVLGVLLLARVMVTTLHTHHHPSSKAEIMICN